MPVPGSIETLAALRSSTPLPSKLTPPRRPCLKATECALVGERCLAPLSSIKRVLSRGPQGRGPTGTPRPHSNQRMLLAHDSGNTVGAAKVATRFLEGLL